jgi:hypothetical protein
MKMGTHTTKAKGMQLFVLALGIVLMSAAAQAGVLYSTGFESGEGFSLGDINGQNNWVAGIGGGSVVADGGNWILDLPTPADNWGPNVSRVNTESTERYAIVEMDFKISETAKHFWFMDNDDGGSVLASLDWETGWGAGRVAYTSSSPGIPMMVWQPDTWYHFGMEVDQNTGLITAANYDGVWKADNDTVGVSGALDRFVIGTLGEGGVGHLYMDNLSVTDSDTPVSIPEPASIVAFAIGVIGLVGLLTRRRRA